MHEMYQNMRHCKPIAWATFGSNSEPCLMPERTEAGVDAPTPLACPMASFRPPPVAGPSGRRASTLLFSGASQTRARTSATPPGWVFPTQVDRLQSWNSHDSASASISPLAPASRSPGQHSSLGRPIAPREGATLSIHAHRDRSTATTPSAGNEERPLSRYSTQHLAKYRHANVVAISTAAGAEPSCTLPSPGDVAGSVFDCAT